MLTGYPSCDGGYHRRQRALRKRFTAHQPRRRVLSCGHDRRQWPPYQRAAL